MTRQWYFIVCGMLSLVCVVGAGVWLYDPFCMRNSYSYVPFDVSMKTEQHLDKVSTPWGVQVMKTFRMLYERANRQCATYSPTAKIPRIIHQIWLGSPFPEKYRAWQRSWKQYHPEWEYRLWTDAEIEPLAQIPGFFVGNTYQYYQEATNYGERSDILRLLLLYYYGGLYVDTDFEALRSCEILHHYYDFYTGMQPLDVAFAQLGYALIGAAPRHPLIKLLIDRLDLTRGEQAIVARTGPVMMTVCLVQHILQAAGTVVVLPASYFYPMGYEQAHEPPAVWQRPESFAVHHWEGSWLTQKADRRSHQL
jgi:inositol phosphorylceramide mannosyltransferase catalytic subunit